MLVSFAVAVVCGLLFGLAPMMHTRSTATAEALKSSPRGSSGTTRHRVRRALVMAEVALAVIVVAGAGLLLRTVHNLTAVDTGFDRSRLVTFSITLPVAAADLRHGSRLWSPQQTSDPYISEAVAGAARRARGHRGDGDDRPAARSSARVQPDGDRELHRHIRSADPASVLPARHVRLLRDDGHPDPAGPWLSIDG